jgi:hypothetical protein
VSVAKWKGQQAIAWLVCLPLSLDDKTKTEECGNVMLSLLEQAGIIKVTGKDTSEDDDLKWMITVGDGLSQMRMRQYNGTIDAASINFRQYYCQPIVLSRVMNRVLMIPGDLHRGVSIPWQQSNCSITGPSCRYSNTRWGGNVFKVVTLLKPINKVPLLPNCLSEKSKEDCMECLLPTMWIHREWITFFRLRSRGDSKCVSCGTGKGVSFVDGNKVDYDY